MSKVALKNALTWAKEKNIHIISDEIYALSVYEGQHMLSLAYIQNLMQRLKK